MSKMLLRLMTASASGVVGPLAPSAMIRTRLIDLLDRITSDLTFQGAGDQHISFLGDPGIAFVEHVTFGMRLGFIDRAVLVGDGLQELGIDTIGVAESVGTLVRTVPAGNASHLAAQELDETDGGILRDVAEPLHGSYRLGRVDLEMLHGLTHSVDDAETSGFSTTQRATATQRLTSDHTRSILTDQLGVLVHHPAHHLRGGTHIGSGHVLAGADVAPHLVHPTAAQFFLLEDGESGRVDRHATLATAQGDIGNGALPGHPHGEGAHGIEVSAGWKRMPPLLGPRTSLCWTR